MIDALESRPGMTETIIFILLKVGPTSTKKVNNVLKKKKLVMAYQYSIASNTFFGWRMRKRGNGKKTIFFLELYLVD